MSKLLIAEPPLQVLPTLAKAIGLNEAIVLQQVYYRALRSKDDGWVQRSLAEWLVEDFPFWSEKTVKRAMTELCSLGVMEREHAATATGREMRLRVDREALEALEEGAGGSGQFDPTHRVTLASPIGSDRPDALPKRTAETLHVPGALPLGHEAAQGETPLPPEGDSASISTGVDPVEAVFVEWVRCTGRRPGSTVLDSKRRRKVVAALKLMRSAAIADGAEAAVADERALADVLDAVRGWRRIPHNCGQNDGGTVFNDLDLLVRNAGNIERFRDAERGGKPILAGPDAPARPKAGDLSFVDRLGGGDR